MPVISIRVSDEWLAMVDAEAERRLWSRNAAIVNILWQALGDDNAEKKAKPQDLRGARGQSEGA